MKLVALPAGKQGCIHSPAVNVPSKLDSVCAMLPRLPSQAEMIPIKFKRKLKFTGQYLYDYVTPQKVIRALSWLQQNSPLYSEVPINLQWDVQARNDNNELFNWLAILVNL